MNAHRELEHLILEDIFIKAEFIYMPVIHVQKCIYIYLTVIMLLFFLHFPREPQYLLLLDHLDLLLKNTHHNNKLLVVTQFRHNVTFFMHHPTCSSKHNTVLTEQ